jgi:DNA-binding CsgD family transcriptional regulator
VLEDRTSSAAVPLFPDLTDREREVLGLIAQGLTNNAIAERLVLSPKMVRNYITEIFSKLQVEGQKELAKLLLGDQVGRLAAEQRQLNSTFPNALSNGSHWRLVHRPPNGLRVSRAPARTTSMLGALGAVLAARGVDRLARWSDPLLGYSGLMRAI